jgi:hypothetical protein
MSVTITVQKQVSAQNWTLSWVSNLINPTFYIYQNGILQAVTPSKTGTFRVTTGAQLLIEVLDDPNQKPSLVYSGVVFIGWYQVPSAAAYTIEKWSGGAWANVDTVPDIGAWWLSWTSPYLPDSQPYQFRVTPIGANGNPGTPQIFTGFMVRVPDAPGNTFTLNPDSTVTIT